MKMLKWVGLVALIILSVQRGNAAPARKTSKEALQALQGRLIGSWRCTGEPFGTREERDKGFWQEKLHWQWKFKKKDVWLLATFEKGKYFTKAELRYLPARAAYELKATTTGKKTLTFEGKLVGKRLTLARTDAKAKQDQRLVFSLNHSNRYVYLYETKPTDHEMYKQIYRVGATKIGVDFASEDDGRPECVVSGGLGTMPVMHKGKTYYVCCTGCRDAFNDEPETYIKQYEARKARKKKKK
jgi:hypothetical protein